MAATETPQTAIDEQELDNPALLKALEQRQNAKEDVKTARKAYKELDDRTKAILSEQAIDDGTVVRIGRFRITKTAVPSRTVQFETDPTSRLTISLIPE